LSSIGKEKGIDNSKSLINDGNMLAIHSMQLQKEVKSNPKLPSCKKKVCAPQKGHCEKKSEIQGGGQEMAWW